MTDAIELVNRGLSCTIVPEFGASVVRLDFTKRGETYQILSPTPAELLVPGMDPRLLALTHIAPIGGPVRHNKFKLDGKEMLLQANLPDKPFFTNGLVWQRPWTGKKQGKNAATCTLVHKANALWPFSFNLTAIFDLEEDQLVVSYEIANDSRQGTMPTGLGATMRLPKLPSTLISSGVSNIWHEDSQQVPLNMAEVPFSLDLKEGLNLDTIETHDRYYSGWIGKASIDYPTSRLSLMLKAEDGLEHLGFSSKKADNFFRLTPLSHVPGMLDIKGYDEEEVGYIALSPGESRTAKFKLDVDLSLY